MERVRDSNEAETAGKNDVSLVWQDESPALHLEEAMPGLKTFLTSDVILDLLHIPKDGLIKISAALLFLGSNEQFAFYWRDTYDGKQHSKLLPADAVRAAFHSMSFDSGWMPAGTLRFGMDTTGTRWVSIFLPPARHLLSILDNDLGLQRVEVPLPGFIFTGCGRNYWIWAVKDAEVTPQTLVYHAPLSNVGTSGSICFGANRPPEADGATMQHAFHLFLDSPFNGHLSASKSRRHQGDIRYHLTELAAQNAALYPHDDLCNIATYDRPKNAVTLDLLLKHIIPLRR